MELAGGERAPACYACAPPGSGGRGSASAGPAPCWTPAGAGRGVRTGALAVQGDREPRPRFETEMSEGGASRQTQTTDAPPPAASVLSSAGDGRSGSLIAAGTPCLKMPAFGRDLLARRPGTHVIDPDRRHSGDQRPKTLVESSRPRARSRSRRRPRQTGQTSRRPAVVAWKSRPVRSTAGVQRSMNSTTQSSSTARPSTRSAPEVHSVWRGTCRPEAGASSAPAWRRHFPFVPATQAAQAVMRFPSTAVAR